MSYPQENTGYGFYVQNQSAQRVYNSRNPFAHAVAEQHVQNNGEQDIQPPSYESLQREDTPASTHIQGQTSRSNYGYYEPYTQPGPSSLTQELDLSAEGLPGQGVYKANIPSLPPPSEGLMRPSALAGPSSPYTHSIDSRPFSSNASTSAERQAAPGSSQEAGFGAKLKHIAAGSSVASLLDPPPPSFLRPPAHDLAYAPFQPAVLMGRSTKLASGFPPLAPQCPAVPHPFSTHDVGEEDWRRFVHDIGAAASLSATERVVAGVAPMAMHTSMITGFIISNAIEKRMMRKKVSAIGELIDTWNQNFFHPRRMYIVLAQGSIVYSGGPDEPLPDMPGKDVIHYGHRDDNSESDSSDSSFSGDESESRRDRRKQRRQDRRDRKNQRREDKRHRREEKRKRKESQKQPFRLVAAYKP
ncbi:hypothetical protein WOLCODRAFT_145106 [Wolfiporia cocos MD-104 SS10]|uniref:Uncharacterized protein n=1 Tax=Wolfiporia cocos (strain MD-104) TaxID=742152 RepID=A0A2H3JR95_WOLCO|nr:hypothetical protein WOLCODRAFT_145106 [Wolfiporia cocos MD-104 SS10]